jgi:hypothetical protein
MTQQAQFATDPACLLPAIITFRIDPQAILTRLTPWNISFEYLAYSMHCRAGITQPNGR